ncbi:MAG TPA: TA system VapC family ribonuclease toxin [Phycisphaerae bacterium]|nr:TA system VapC family ribonuclease toxin [Phycisphaerae bacterium]
MSIFLLDTNVLIALGWPSHPHNHAAHRWMNAIGTDRWATCPVTECGFVRISSNKRALPSGTTPAAAIALLNGLKTDARHVFWEDSISICNIRLRHNAIQGYQQVTDAYLLSLCLAKGGRVATFDQGFLSLATTDAERTAVFVVPI